MAPKRWKLVGLTLLMCFAVFFIQSSRLSFHVGSGNDPASIGSSGSDGGSIVVGRGTHDADGNELPADAVAAIEQDRSHIDASLVSEEPPKERPKYSSFHCIDQGTRTFVGRGDVYGFTVINRTCLYKNIVYDKPTNSFIFYAPKESIGGVKLPPVSLASRPYDLPIRHYKRKIIRRKVGPFYEWKPQVREGPIPTSIPLDPQWRHLAYYMPIVAPWNYAHTLFCDLFGLFWGMYEHDEVRPNAQVIAVSSHFHGEFPLPNRNAAFKMFSRYPVQYDVALPSAVFPSLIAGTGTKSWSWVTPTYTASGTPQLWYAFRHHLMHVTEATERADIMNLMVSAAKDESVGDGLLMTKKRLKEFVYPLLGKSALRGGGGGRRQLLQNAHLDEEGQGAENERKALIETTTEDPLRKIKGGGREEEQGDTKSSNQDNSQEAEQALPGLGDQGALAGLTPKKTLPSSILKKRKKENKNTENKDENVVDELDAADMELELAAATASEPHVSDASTVDVTGLAEVKKQEGIRNQIERDHTIVGPPVRVSLCHKKDKRGVTNYPEAISFLTKAFAGRNVTFHLESAVGKSPKEQVEMMVTTDIYICNEGTLATSFFLMPPGSVFISLPLVYHTPHLHQRRMPAKTRWWRAPDLLRPDPRLNTGGNIDWFPPAIPWVKTFWYDYIPLNETIIQLPLHNLRNYMPEFNIVLLEKRLVPLVEAAVQWVQRKRKEAKSVEGKTVDRPNYSINADLCRQLLLLTPELTTSFNSARCYFGMSWLCEFYTNTNHRYRSFHEKWSLSRGRCGDGHRSSSIAMGLKDTRRFSRPVKDFLFYTKEELLELYNSTDLGGRIRGPSDEDLIGVF